MKDINSDVLKKCIKKLDDSVIISLEVKPGSKMEGIDGVNKFRESLVVRVKAVAQKGRANMELIGYLSEILSLPKSNIVIIKGATSKRKEIKIQGITQDEIIKRLILFKTD